MGPKKPLDRDGGGPLIERKEGRWRSGEKWNYWRCDAKNTRKEDKLSRVESSRVQSSGGDDTSALGWK